jgi:hypothetical protein
MRIETRCEEPRPGAYRETHRGAANDLAASMVGSYCKAFKNLIVVYVGSPA